jgi:hypothetical protein
MCAARDKRSSSSHARAAASPHAAGSPGARPQDPETEFSDQLEDWLRSDEPRTFGDMADVFGEQGFAVMVILFMSMPALPLPTGGVTHLFEAVTILIAAQMVLGRRTVWLPGRLRRRELGPLLADKAIPFIVRRVRWFERHSSRRGAALFGQVWFLRILGVLLIAFCIGSAVAPPFSGLDTLPALGAVVIGLAIVLEDVVVLAAGVAIGVGGVALIVSIGAAVSRVVRGLF